MCVCVFLTLFNSRVFLQIEKCRACVFDSLIRQIRKFHISIILNTPHTLYVTNSIISNPTAPPILVSLNAYVTNSMHTHILLRSQSQNKFFRRSNCSNKFITMSASPVMITCAFLVLPSPLHLLYSTQSELGSLETFSALSIVMFACLRIRSEIA